MLMAGLFIAVAVLAGFLWLDSLGPVIERADQIELSGPTMGTRFNITLIPRDRDTTTDDIDVVSDRVTELLSDINAKMSTYDPESELSRFNSFRSTESFEVSPETFEVVSTAQQVSEMTDGAFDVTIGPLVNAWGFGPERRSLEGPSPREHRELMQQFGFDKLELIPDEHALAKRYPALHVDLSAIAKGYAVDRIAAALDELGWRDYLVEVGGEVRTAGANSRDEPWRIAIKKPITNSRAADRIIRLSGKALATSGDYQNYYEVDGVRLSHTINPATGRPIAHKLASVSVIHDECMWADALATAISVMGPEKGLAFAQKHDLAVYLIVREDGETYDTAATAQFKAFIDKRDPESAGTSTL